MTITSDERGDGSLSDVNHRQATEALQSAGAVILEGAVDLAHLQVLKMKTDAEWEQQRSPAGAGHQLDFNFKDGHLQQDSPDHPDYIFSDVVANPLNEQIVRDLAGEDARLAAYTGNTNSPDTKAQPLHSDVRRDRNEMGVVSLVTNIPLVDVTQANGLIELWLGTHEYDVCHTARDTSSSPKRKRPRIAQ